MSTTRLFDNSAAKTDNRPAAAATHANLIDRVINEAKKHFTDGFDNSEQFRSKIRQGDISTTKIRNGKDALTYERFPCYDDAYFPSYNANRISSTNFIAAKGPDSDSVADFFYNTAFNSRLPIKEIIALGSCLYGKGGAREDGDFCDYCSGKDEEVTFIDKDSKTSIKVQAQRTSGTLITPEDIDTERYPQGIIKSSLNVSLLSTADNKETNLPTKQVNVTTYALEDNDTINLASAYQKCVGRFTQSVEQRKEILWQLFKKSLSEPILIHCTSGVGRTGHLILTFELLKHYHYIFASQNSAIISTRILNILHRIRETRPALVATTKQFEDAIRNADILYRYALEKKYIEADKPVSESVFEIERRQRSEYDGPRLS